MDPLTIVAALLAGAAIGLVLGLVGGGGSILAGRARLEQVAPAFA